MLGGRRGPPHTLWDTARGHCRHGPWKQLASPRGQEEGPPMGRMEAGPLSGLSGPGPSVLTEQAWLLGAGGTGGPLSCPTRLALPGMGWCHLEAVTRGQWPVPRT